MHAGLRRIGSLLLAAALATPGFAAAAGDASYQLYCASCHGPEGRGDGPRASELARPPADLARLHERYGFPLPKTEFLRRLGAAHPGLDPWMEEPGFCARDLMELDAPRMRRSMRRGTALAILQYLDTLQERESAPIPAKGRPEPGAGL